MRLRTLFAFSIMLASAFAFTGSAFAQFVYVNVQDNNWAEKRRLEEERIRIEQERVRMEQERIKLEQQENRRREIEHKQRMKDRDDELTQMALVSSNFNPTDCVHFQDGVRCKKRAVNQGFCAKHFRIRDEARKQASRR